jgi:hypothetical protein
MSEGNRPSIAALQRLEQRMESAPWDRTTPHTVSNAEYDLGRFDGPADADGVCALRNAAPVLLEIAATAVAWQRAVRERCDYGTATYANNPFDITSPQFKAETASLDAVADDLMGKFLAALDKVRQ